MHIPIKTRTYVFIFTSFTLAACAISNANPHQTPLTEPGNDVFATVQEAIKNLLADKNTDWQQVNTEALRQHLLDMKNFTENVSVLEKTEIADGVLLKVKAAPEAQTSMERAVAAHPAQLLSESGWVMEVDQQSDIFNLRVTTANPEDVDKIRGLGYIGLMAMGDHHTQHHWMMVNGMNAH